VRLDMDHWGVEPLERPADEDGDGQLPRKPQLNHGDTETTEQVRGIALHSGAVRRVIRSGAITIRFHAYFVGSVPLG
jgi:hypothetical protein